MKKAVLIGTSHSIQRSDSSFGACIDALCNEHNICAIAEEIENTCASIALGVAQKLDIAYKIIEPTPEEAVALGIEQVYRIDYEFITRYDLKDSPNIGNLSVEAYDEYSARKLTTYRQRENEWLKRIKNLNTWPVLIICGKDHSQAFSKLLISNGVDLHPESILTY